MATATTYETGFFSTPSDLATAAAAVNDQVNAIDSAIDGNADIPQAWWDSFTSFMQSWRAFYSQNFAGGIWQTRGSWLTGDLQAQLVSFEQQAAAWKQQANQFTGVAVPGPDLQPDTSNPLDGLKPILPSSTTVIVVLVLIALIVFGEKVL